MHLAAATLIFEAFAAVVPIGNLKLLNSTSAAVISTPSIPLAFTVIAGFVVEFPKPKNLIPALESVSAEVTVNVELAFTITMSPLFAVAFVTAWLILASGSFSVPELESFPLTESTQ